MSKASSAREPGHHHDGDQRHHAQDIDLGLGGDSLTLASANNTLSIKNVETLVGAGGDDSITLSAAYTGGTLNGGGGTDDLTFNAAGAT